VAQFYDSLGVIFLIAVPHHDGLFASEKTNGTQELLLTSPLTIWDVVLGKFAAGALFYPIWSRWSRCSRAPVPVRRPRGGQAVRA